MSIKVSVKRLLCKESIRQFAGLFTVNMLGLPLGFVTSILITRYLGAQDYGNYKFIDSVFRLAIILCNFGLYYAMSRALLLNNDRKRAREYYAVTLLMTLFLSIVMCVGLLIYAFCDHNIAEKGLLSTFLCILPFGMVYILNYCFEVLLQADRQIGLLARVRLFPKIGYLFGGAVALMFMQNVQFSKLLLVCYIYLVTQIVVYIHIFVKLSPKFQNLLQRWREVKQYNKEYGVDVYVGALFATGFAILPDLFISYFGLNNQGVGFYSLALMLSSPLSFIPSTIATMHYKEYANRKDISRKSIVVTIALSLFVMLVLWIAVPIFIKYFYPPEFNVVSKLCQIVSIGVLLYGMADFLNKFVGAKGQGKLLRNSSFAVGFSVLIFNIALVPTYGAFGAALAKLLAGVVYVSIMIFCYIITVRNQSNNK